MATAVTDLERLLRVTVVHSPLVPPKEAKNLHRGSFVLLPDSSLSDQAVNTLSRAVKDVSFSGPVGERYPTAARLPPANVALPDCGKDRLHEAGRVDPFIAHTEQIRAKLRGFRP